MALSRYDIFISHKHTEWPFARSLFTSLSSKGYSCWYDADGMHSGKIDQIFQYIDDARDVIVIINKGNLKNAKTEQWKEDFFCREVEYALRKKKNIIPILLIDAKYLPSTKELKDPFKGIWQYKYLTCLSSDSYDGMVHYTLVKKGFLSSNPLNNEYIQLDKKEIVVSKYKLNTYRYVTALLTVILLLGTLFYSDSEKSRQQETYNEIKKYQGQIQQTQDSINNVIKEQHSLQESFNRMVEIDWQK